MILIYTLVYPWMWSLYDTGGEVVCFLFWQPVSRFTLRWFPNQSLQNIQKTGNIVSIPFKNDLISVT